MDELTGEFVAETRETLEGIADALLAWEAQPHDLARLDEIFRFVHTVKGSCGFLDLPRIGRLAHAAETVLADLRRGERQSSPGLVNALLAIIDRIAVLTDALETQAAVPPGETDDSLTARLDDPDVAAIATPVLTGKSRAIRVSLDLLESAMTQVSDLVLARNELGKRIRESGGDPAITAAFDRVSTSIGDIRESITRTRMQPIARLFAMLPRLVRDTAAAVGKPTALHIEDSDVEIDREMIESIRDPLTHIIRNAIDHGIESADIRRQRNKPATGTVSVYAEQSGNQVSITVRDDGRGIDTERLVEKALAANIISASKAASLTAEAAAQLIFAPGLSTAADVTEISGRGVGMDVVRENVERLGGAITLENRPGIGLAITLRAPLTLSIMHALLVGAGEQTFALPRAAIGEIISVAAGSVRVEALGCGHVAVLRDRLVPVVSLASVLGLAAQPFAYLVMVELTGGSLLALGVDSIGDHEELVVRPIAPQLASLGLFAGQTLPDHGTPVLLIDAAGIAVRAGLESANEPVLAERAAPVEQLQTESVLVFESLAGDRQAIRARDVARIDDVAMDDMIVRGDRAFARVADTLLPVIAEGPLPADGALAVLRLRAGADAVGYAVRAVHDLAPLAAVTPVDDDDVIEGLTFVAGDPVALLRWPRLPAPAQRRRA